MNTSTTCCWWLMLILNNFIRQGTGGHSGVTGGHSGPQADHREARGLKGSTSPSCWRWLKTLEGRGKVITGGHKEAGGSQRGHGGGGHRDAQVLKPARVDFKPPDYSVCTDVNKLVWMKYFCILQNTTSDTWNMLLLLLLLFLFDTKRKFWDKFLKTKNNKKIVLGKTRNNKVCRVD